MEKINIKTSRRNEFIDITSDIQEIIAKSEIKKGVCVAFIPHTTAGITINENADPAVVSDILKTLEKMIPEKGAYLHSEGNSDAHIKSSLMGSSVSVIIENGELQLGTWQGIYFAEFDGPRRRELWVSAYSAS